MKILAIETSCDETSIALIEKQDAGKYTILSQETISQINMHREFGGVYPTLSRREHEKNLVPLLHKVLTDGGILKLKNQEAQLRDDSAILESLGNEVELLERYPDLKENVFDFFSKYELTEQTRLSCGYERSRTTTSTVGGSELCESDLYFDFRMNNSTIPIYPINHMEGHIVGGIAERNDQTVSIPKINYPAVCLLISGGHTELVLSRESGMYEKIGETQDDAVGEAYDKVARLLGLPYPGGPEISKLAKLGREQNVESLNFPRPMMHTKDLNFSFSGLKTHILYFTQANSNLDEDLKIKIATEFEEAVKDVLIYKTKKAIDETGARSLVVGGGVASNIYLKENFEKLAEDLQIDLYYSARELATDNALMIALTCANQIENGVTPTTDFIAIGSKNYEW
jgi:N6-L-threonylcarbamoyladenine synthase